MGSCKSIANQPKKAKNISPSQNQRRQNPGTQTQSQLDPGKAAVQNAPPSEDTSQSTKFANVGRNSADIASGKTSEREVLVDKSNGEVNTETGSGKAPKEISKTLDDIKEPDSAMVKSEAIEERESEAPGKTSGIPKTSEREVLVDKSSGKVNLDTGSGKAPKEISKTLDDVKEADSLMLKPKVMGKESGATGKTSSINNKGKGKPKGRGKRPPGENTKFHLIIENGSVKLNEATVMQAFRQMDWQKGDRKLSSDEFVVYFGAQGVSKEESKRLFRDFDENRNGYITFKEFLNYLRPERRTMSKSEAHVRNGRLWKTR